ncbi:Peroxisomal biogenesis factor 8 [Venturia nashicola]|uniref:Peroxisomal biogenesis factor 8 n=1 Tax=Venturia nashicola TaxID=86259 RepID=A0A4Z1P3U3_9PEZI|nr:Peroxisomal biogenesis factor 8 [Venturia nashicola]
MPTDRLLSTLLRSLQTYTAQQDTPRLLGTAASLLNTLHNPLNITLLTAQLLIAPAIWERPEGLRTCLSMMGVFHSATLAVLKKEDEAERRKHKDYVQQFPTQPEEEIVPREVWARAVIKGADERSRRWKHVMALGGLLVGFGPVDDERLSTSMRATIEHAFVQATNLALDEARHGDELGAQCVALALNHSFPLLSDYERTQLDYNLLLPVLIGSAFFSNEGLQSAYFLGAVDLDISVGNNNQLHWSMKSQSYSQVDRILARPLVASLGPLSRLISHAVENVTDSWVVQTMVEDLAGFTKSLINQWRQSRLSMIDAHVEMQRLSEETMTKTVPALWKLLKASLFALVIVLRGAVGRTLSDGVLAANAVAPTMVCSALHALRNLYFISSRLGTDSFSQYTFVYLTSIDILGNYPIQADSFLRDIRPSNPGEIPDSPLDRCLDLYFLNTAEHFSLVLSARTNEELLVSAAVPYLAAGGSDNLLPIFEAAHSVMLSVFSAPQSSVLAAKHLSFYIDALFRVFPDNLSPRQFRLAFKTLLRVTAPPSPLSATQPDLPATLLELVRYRALNAPATPLPPKLPPQGIAITDNEPILSEQAVLVLTLLDALPFLPLDLLEEWLPLAAELVLLVPESSMQNVCRKRLWDVLVSGEMDPERSSICVAWWTTRGGREYVMFGPEGAKEEENYFMSGALGPTKESKL